MFLILFYQDYLEHQWKIMALYK